MTINYRTPQEVMAEAEPVIRAVLPAANVPTSIRRSDVPVVHGSTSDLGSILDTWLAAHADGIVCVIGTGDIQDCTFQATSRVRSLTRHPHETLTHGQAGNRWLRSSRPTILRDMTSSDLWDEETAARYDETSTEMFAPEVLDPAVDLLAELAAGGRALEFAIGTGRVAIPLVRRGVRVTGIELSQPMVDQLRHKVLDNELPVVVGDMATTVVPGEFSLVYVVWNSIGNLRTQDEQAACFRNAARQLSPGGRFVIELWVPGIRRFPPGQVAVPFHVSDRHVGFDTYDMATQRGTSHHYWREDDGSARYGQSNFRYIWPAECDLMAQLAGLELERRMADWDGSAFTSDSESHVSVWRKPD